MLNVQGNKLVFSFPDVHPDAIFEVDVQQTLRVPDDGRRHELPPGLRALPLRAVTGQLAERMGPAHAARGGVATCLYQADALWLRFKPRHSAERRAAYPFAIMVAAGKINAVTGKPWGDGTIVHLMNSGDWRALTGEAPPGRPPTAADYSAARLPWFSHYAEGLAIGNESGAFDGVKTAAQLDAEKGGVKLLPENESCTPAVVVPVPSKPKGNVSPGEW